MTEGVRPNEAAQALTEIGNRQHEVIKLAIIPTWFWWTIAALMVAFAAAVDTGRPVVIGVAVSLFVLGVLAACGRVVLTAVRRVRLRNELLGPAGVLAILGFVALILAVILPTAFALQAAGSAHPATWGVLAGAIVMAVGGPLLTRALQRMMLANRTGTRR